MEPDTPQGGPAPSEAEPAEIVEVRDFRKDIADRQALMNRTDAPSVGRALVAVAEGFYQDNQQRLHQAFDTSLGELSNGTPPGPTNARLVGSVDAATPEDPTERRELAQFHLVFTPDVREQASNAFNAAFVPLASAQAEMPVSEAGELYGFFSIAEPSYARCGESDVCIHYGDSDVFVVSFTRVEESLWTPSAVSWWTRVPPGQPPEGVGNLEPPGEPSGGAAPDEGRPPDGAASPAPAGAETSRSGPRTSVP